MNQQLDMPGRALDAPQSRTFGRAMVWRAALVLAVSAVGAAVCLSVDMAPGYARDAQMAGLIRTMGALKLLTIFPLVFAAAWLRMTAGPVRRLIYIALSASSAAGIAFIITLSDVALGAGLFHLGFLGTLVHASRDPGFADRLEPVAKFLLRR